MKTLSLYEQNCIEQFFKMRQEPLRKAMATYLASKYEKVIATKKYVVAIGNIPVAITSHLDTVFKAPPTNIYYDKMKNVMWSPEGLGADDRAGVFSIIHLIKMGYRPTVIFTTDEEIGSIGAEALMKDMPEPPAPMKYIIEMDRRGSVDCVFYDCNNPEFEKYAESFGFTTNFGTFSDISVICPSWGVAGVNFSVGYYNEHSVSETLNIGQMFATIDKVKKMFDDIANSKEFEYIPSVYSYNSLFSTAIPSEDDPALEGWGPSFGISKTQWRSWFSPTYKCAGCGDMDYNYNLVPVVKTKGDIEYFCPDCITKYDFPVCKECGNFYMTNDKKKDNGLCACCEKKVPY